MNGNAAIISEEYLRNLEETCYLCSVQGVADSIVEGLKTSERDCVKIDWKKALK